jgi:hypothetical protein
VKRRQRKELGIGRHTRDDGRFAMLQLEQFRNT